MEAINIKFEPATGTAEEWNEAYERLADYFRSYRLHHRIRRTQLILETLNRAAKAHAEEPDRHPTELAIEQARSSMRTWLAGIYQDLQMTEEQIEASGRLGFHLANGPEKWSTSFLDDRTVPNEMADAMRNAVRTSGPRLQVSKMTPRDIDLGLTEVAEDTFEGLGRHPVFRYLLLLLLVLSILGYVYQLLR